MFGPNRRPRNSSPERSEIPLISGTNQGGGGHPYGVHNISTTLLDERTPVYDPNTMPAKFKRRPTPLRRALEKNWDRAVKGGCWPRLIYALFGVALLGVWVGLIVYFAANEVRAQNKSFTAIENAVRHYSGGRNYTEFWYLQGALTQFETKTRTLTVKWALLWSQNGSDPQPFGISPEHTSPIGIYRDQSLVAEKPFVYQQIKNITESYPSDDLHFAGLRIDNETLTPTAVVGMHSWDDFYTDISLQQAIAGHAWTTPLMGFPLDRWSGSIVFVANYQVLSKAYNVSNSFGTWIDDAYLADSILNWRVSATTTNTCANSTGNWLDTDSSPCQLKIDLVAHRPGLVIFATVVAVAVNWLSTIFIFIMTCEGVIMQRAHVIERTQLLAVCFTALFALPSVRSILPGVPEFGALIDLVGIIPNVMIISLCTTVLAIASLRSMVDRRHEQQRRLHLIDFPSPHRSGPGFRYGP